jgi:para-aminobenzoate synthetase
VHGRFAVTVPGVYRVHVQPVSAVTDLVAAFDVLFRDRPASCWLDSSSAGDGRSRYSVMGAAIGPLGELIGYDVTSGKVVVRDADGARKGSRQESLFAYLERELAQRTVPDTGLPCDFDLGYVGYFGYELKALCGGRATHRSALPDGCFVFCDRGLVVDAVSGTAWLLALSTPETVGSAVDWLARAQRTLAGLPASTSDSIVAGAEVALCWRHELGAYRDLIRECLREIAAGESYEICLTNSLTAPLTVDPWVAYQVLRRVNPAPYAAYLAVPGCAVLSSSPERFLRIDPDGHVESRPIKGTRRRGDTPGEDAALAAELRTAEKDRAENLMIVDLVRNDLGRVARPGSVRVTGLFEVETHPTVHQLVSTVGARLRAGVSPVAAVRAAFPGGSMTGAPKLRTMEIIDRLEGAARGIYSGALGYLALGGAVDLSIVIRTMVVADGVATIGTGGAIVAQSDPDAEVAEIETKAAALVRVLSSTSAPVPVTLDRQSI